MHRFKLRQTSHAVSTALALCIASTGAMMFTSGLAQAATLADQYNPQTLDRLMQAKPAEGLVRLSPVREAALEASARALGTQTGLIEHAKEIAQEVHKRRVQMERTFRFGDLVIGNGVLPPVLIRTENASTINDDTMRLAGAIYEIKHPARFFSGAPSWRDWLLMGLPVDAQLPSPPTNEQLLPRDDNERAYWQAKVKEAYLSGRVQAREIFDHNLSMLEEIYGGMRTFYDLYQRNMVSAPVIAKSQEIVTQKDKNTIIVGDTLFRITMPAQFQTNPEAWNALQARPDTRPLLPIGHGFDPEQVRHAFSVYQQGIMEREKALQKEFIEQQPFGVTILDKEGNVVEKLARQGKSQAQALTQTRQAAEQPVETRQHPHHSQSLQHGQHYAQYHLQPQLAQPQAQPHIAQGHQGDLHQGSAHPQTAYPAGAYQPASYQPVAYPVAPHPQTPYPQPAHPQQAAYPAAAYPQPMYQPAAYPHPAYPVVAYPQAAYPHPVYPAGSHPHAAYPAAAYPQAAYQPVAYPQAPSLAHPQHAHPQQAHPYQGSAGYQVAPYPGATYPPHSGQPMQPAHQQVYQQSGAQQAVYQPAPAEVLHLRVDSNGVTRVNELNARSVETSNDAERLEMMERVRHWHQSQMTSQRHANTLRQQSSRPQERLSRAATPTESARWQRPLFSSSPSGLN